MGRLASKHIVSLAHDDQSSAPAFAERIPFRDSIRIIIGGPWTRLPREIMHYVRKP